MGRIKGVRRKLSQELGFLVPPVHIRDNLDLEPHAYRITLMGVNVADAELQPELELAINPGQVYGELAGDAVKDPVFGLEAVWIEPGKTAPGPDLRIHRGRPQHRDRDPPESDLARQRT